MQLHFGLDMFRPEWAKCVGCIGTFDGVHLGHQAVISRAVSQALKAEEPSVLFTFDRHPAHVLAPDKAPEPIASLDENLTVIETLGISAAVVLHFDRALSEMSAGEFLGEIIEGASKCGRLVVGHDFAFGHNREGSTKWLQERIPTTVVAPFEIDGARVSSSAIRAAIARGQIETAARMLGRPFAISGVVVAGNKLGRQLGFPTANIARTAPGITPPDGVYAGRMEVAGSLYPAAISIGRRPAVGGGERTIEAHLLDYSGGSLYGTASRIELVEHLRAELDFASLDDLRAQIAKDVDRIRSGPRN